MQFYDAFDNPDHFTIVLEYMSGGDLFTTIVERLEVRAAAGQLLPVCTSWI